ncbi:MAG: PEGA domain-containing protein [Tepidisphaeraceae bacterium]
MVWPFLIGGCVERTLSVNSDPPGALVYLNDQEIGRTPMEHDFVWYGKYDVALRMEGYETLKTSQQISMPVYQLPPIDLLAELVPITFRDEKSLFYRLTPQAATAEDAGALVGRALDAKGQLQSSRHAAATRPE